MINQVECLRSELASERREIKQLKSDVSYKEKERIRLENRVKYDGDRVEKRHKKEVSTLGENMKKRISRRDANIVKLSNERLSEKKVVNQVSCANPMGIDRCLFANVVCRYCKTNSSR